jgi:hypothetical protein
MDILPGGGSMILFYFLVSDYHLLWQEKQAPAASDT